ncbi:retron St85 family RNA-directed DNA polymerase [Agarivorans sp. TSD2052]|uniref:retron St85 family RNA-directed DNA polymerase n=1 Tax=Agarivorans sp. TSD2052 TaxID=2937286 RepID=UPI002010875D|nr:retron St85 family RNA-directed DNA polymerase [Agarivorans sp. TSD2052]UPW18578.1 retron St85 family RNA-directed DNA polymerase [Agarivorans sp. TSD2052]
MSIISQIAQTLKKPEYVIEDILFIAPMRYKIYYIPKRTHGFRQIAQPSKELKECQRAFLRFCNLPTHNCAMAYREGLSIKENAIAHKNQAYLLKLDFENFFNSITPNIFWHTWELTGAELPTKDNQQWIEKLLFWNLEDKLVLSVGAPSSPSVSNFCVLIFDQMLQDQCQSLGIKYTRYADDLTFSTNEKDILFQIPESVENILSKCFNGNLRLNKGKTIFSSKAHNRHVTGITITNSGKISLGRSKKRYIKHKVHQFSLELLNNHEVMHLKGLMAYARHIEPSFYESLIRKYSKELIERIFEVPNE